jgi:hypothetical protein
MPARPAGRQHVEEASNQQLTNPTLPFTQITAGKMAVSGVWKVPITYNLLKKNGAGDRIRTGDVQLGEMSVD